VPVDDLTTRQHVATREQISQTPLLRRRRRASDLVVVLIFALIAVALGNGFGVQSRTVEETAGGVTLTVEYAGRTRGGLATPFAITVTKPGGFDGAVTVAVAADYLAMFDENGLDPDPAGATADDDSVVWTFTPPDGDKLGISYDARIEPGVQWGQRGEVAVLDDSGEPTVAVTFQTWVFP
jgi:hypothetical protein